MRGRAEGRLFLRGGGSANLIFWLRGGRLFGNLCTCYLFGGRAVKKSQGEGRGSPRDFFTLSPNREHVHRLLFGGRRSLECGCLFEKIAAYERVGKSVIWVCKKAQKGKQMQTQWVPFLAGWSLLVYNC